MNQTVYDIAILGAGPVGQALALLLARASAHPERIVLLAGSPRRPDRSRQPIRACWP